MAARPAHVPDLIVDRCTAAAPLFDLFQPLLDPYDFASAELNLKWHAGRAAFELRPIVSGTDPSVCPCRRQRPVDIVAAHAMLKSELTQVLNALRVPFGSTTVHVENGQVDEVVVVMRIKRTDRFISFDPYWKLPTEVK